MLGNIYRNAIGDLPELAGLVSKEEYVRSAVYINSHAVQISINKKPTYAIIPIYSRRYAKLG